jgi:hypothetical protein
MQGASAVSVSLSFNGYSSGKLAEIAARVVQELFGISLSGRPKWHQFFISSVGFFFGYLVNGVCKVISPSLCIGSLFDCSKKEDNEFSKCLRKSEN